MPRDSQLTHAQEIANFFWKDKQFTRRQMTDLYLGLCVHRSIYGICPQDFTYFYLLLCLLQRQVPDRCPNHHSCGSCPLSEASDEEELIRSCPRPLSQCVRLQQGCPDSLGSDKICCLNWEQRCCLVLWGVSPPSCTQLKLLWPWFFCPGVPWPSGRPAQVTAC